MTRNIRLENTLSRIAGHAVDITVRGLRSFTVSFDQVDRAAADRVVQFFGALAQCTVDVDDETGTYVYIEVGR